MKESKGVRGNCWKQGGVPVRKVKAGKSLSSEPRGGEQERRDVGWRLVGPHEELEFYPGWKPLEVCLRVPAGK